MPRSHLGNHSKPHDLSWGEVVPKGGVEPPFRVYESLVLAVELLRLMPNISVLKNPFQRRGYSGAYGILTYFAKKYSTSSHFRDISEYMWNTLLTINSVIWAVTATYFVYSIGAAILKADGRIFLVGLGLFLLSLILQIILGGLSK